MNLCFEKASYVLEKIVINACYHYCAQIYIEN